VARLRKLFGKRLRELRADRGYNQLYLATLASVSEDFISLIERGISQPSFETIEALAESLERDVATMFTFPGQAVDRKQVRMVRKKKSVRGSGRPSPIRNGKSV